MIHYFALISLAIYNLSITSMLIPQNARNLPTNKSGIQNLFKNKNVVFPVNFFKFLSQYFFTIGY